MAMAQGTPTKLGRYEIVDEIGKGAMGVVYLAKDPLIGRLVALKTIRPSAHADDEDTREFIEINNPAALKEIAQRFEEAASRGLWTPRLNSAYDLLRDLQQ